MLKRKLYLGIGFALLVIFITVYFLLDINFVRKSSLGREGLGFDTIEESYKLRNRLDEQGVSYSVEHDGDGIKIWWNKEHVQTEGNNQLIKHGVLPEEITGLCFPKEPAHVYPSLVDKLASSDIVHSIDEANEELCISWSIEDDLAVQGVYPNLKQIRQHQRGVH